MKNAMIVDYGCGNVTSLKYFLNRFNLNAEITSNVDKILEGDLLILPGVGAFGNAQDAMNDANIFNSIYKRVHLDKPTLGICLGFQLLTKTSEEAPSKVGLSFFDAKTVKMHEGSEIGWREILTSVSTYEQKNYYFFNHSFGILSNSNDIEASLIPGSSYLAYARKSMIVGVQFHPEKSQLSGRKFMEVLLKQVWNL